VTWLEGRHLVGVWGEQRARHSIDAVQELASTAAPSDDGSGRRIAAVALGTQTGVVVALDLTPIDNLDPLRRALVARHEFLREHEAKQKKKLVLPSTAPRPVPENAPPVPPPQILPELARFSVDLPPAPSETLAPGQYSKLGLGGNRAAHSAAISSRFVALHMFDGMAFSRCLTLTDYGRLFVHRRDAAAPATDAASWTCADGADGEPGVALFSELPPLPRGAIAGPSVKGGPVRVGRVRGDNVLFYAGRSLLPREYDIETGKVTWKAMNQPQTPARLEPPVWVTGLALHHGNARVVTVSAYCDLCIYDPRAQKRAVYHSKYREGGALKSVEVSPDDQTYVISDNKGYVSLWCARQQRELGGLKMATGAQSSLAFLDADPPLVATTGLDRFVHIYDRSKGRQLYQFYLKQRMNHVLLSGGAEPLIVAPVVVSAEQQRAQLAADAANTSWDHTAAEPEDENDNDVWTEMPVVVDRKKGEEEADDDDDSDDSDDDDDDDDDDDESEEQPSKKQKPKARLSKEKKAPVSKRNRK
jgi:hypothetical protein